MHWNFITRWALGCINFLRQVHKKNKFLPLCTLSLGTNVLERENNFPVKLTAKMLWILKTFHFSAICLRLMETGYCVARGVDSSMACALLSHCPGHRWM